MHRSPADNHICAAGECRQVKPDSSKYSERRSMNLCLLPELDKNCDFFTVSAVENSDVMSEQLNFSLVLCEPCLLLNNNGIQQIQSYMVYTLTEMKHNWHICPCMMIQSSMQCDEEAYLGLHRWVRCYC